MLLDECLPAVVSAMVADRSFMARYGNPSTRQAAIAQLRRTVHRIRALTLPLSLGDFCQQMRAGEVSVATADGHWQFGMALVKESMSA